MFVPIVRIVTTRATETPEQLLEDPNNGSPNGLKTESKLDGPFIAC